MSRPFATLSPHAGTETGPEAGRETGHDTGHDTGTPSGPDTGFAPGPDSARAFRDVLGQFATGVCVVTAPGPAGPVGMTVNSFAAVSLDPPLVLWSPARASARFAAFAQAEHFAIHVLGAGQAALVQRFTRGGEGFAGLPHALTAEGVPLLAGCLSRMLCTAHARHDGGDHLIVVGEVRRAWVDPGAPLLFSAGRYGAFGPQGV